MIYSAVVVDSGDVGGYSAIYDGSSVSFSVPS